jgi:hypothetical protein
MHVMIIVKRQPKLLHVVLALSSPGGFPSGLNGRKQQRDQNCDDCNHNQQFNQRKSARMEL